MELTKERLACLRVVEMAGGRIDHDHRALDGLSDDRSTLSKPDVFNQCHDAGWLISRHDNRTDTSTASLTQEGRAVLAATVSNGER